MVDGIRSSDKLALSVAEAAELLSISRPTMYTLMRQEGFPRLKVGNRVLIPRQGLEAWVLAQSALN